MDKAKRKKEKSRFIIWVEYIFFMMFYKVLEYLPLAWSMKISSNLIKLLCIVDRRHFKRIVLHIIYSGIETDPQKAKALARANLGEFGKLLVEIAQIKKRFSVDKIRRCGSQAAWKIFDEGTDGKKQLVYGVWETGSKVNGKVLATSESYEAYFVEGNILYALNADKKLVRLTLDFGTTETAKDTIIKDEVTVTVGDNLKAEIVGDYLYYFVETKTTDDNGNEIKTMNLTSVKVK